MPFSHTNSDGVLQEWMSAQTNVQLCCILHNIFKFMRSLWWDSPLQTAHMALRHIRL